MAFGGKWNGRVEYVKKEKELETPLGTGWQFWAFMGVVAVIAFSTVYAMTHQLTAHVHGGYIFYAIFPAWGLLILMSNFYNQKRREMELAKKK
mmetsp:Transcript_68022/g.153916  ORF Transcript_68022/g.153916 Transcript_68022/m.153916 type:complete len:93 (-) Transcript_68022:251-529(-)|eukprot:CAMPEP_0172600704 /NCGR_PEP_ID=MMETSP1068-20121228/20851_1 /TAXON_ID=35684 /ORGANISM="Pseudopedinella elastica, Strain CCMP716" /LENGTH=92 /DNA_ID=CAMNT_0013401445 /DNA_START=328 /DNA_END=606 /DNA_ORIENTATION=-